jgi:hypothetical protein
LSSRLSNRVASPAGIAAGGVQDVSTLNFTGSGASDLEQAERLQRALFAIADLASADLDLPEVYKELHAIVGSLMYAENF